MIIKHQADYRWKRKRGSRTREESGNLSAFNMSKTAIRFIAVEDWKHVPSSQRGRP